MNVPATISNIGWQTLISGMIKDERRGAFFSDRNRLLTIAGMVSTLVIGIIMKNQTNNATAYQWLFFTALLFGLGEVYFLMKHKEKTQSSTSTKKASMNWSIFKDHGTNGF